MFSIVSDLICWYVASLTDPLHLTEEIPGRVIQLVLPGPEEGRLDAAVPPELHHDGGQLGRKELGLLHIGGLTDEQL